MNIFEQQKKEQVLKIETLEEMQKTIEEMKTLESSLQKTSKKILEQLDKIDISKIGETITDNDFRIKDQIKLLETSLTNFKNKSLEVSDSTFKRYSRQFMYFFYLPLICFILSLVAIGYIYFTSISSLKAQNDLLKNRINSVYWILAEDYKIWYDSEEKKLFTNDNEWFKEYKKKLKTPSKKKK